MALVILVILLVIAIPSFSTRMSTVRAEMAAQSFARVVASTRAIASQTGRRTDLYIKTAPSGVSGCSSPAWMVVQTTSSTTTVISCLTMTDFKSRYEGTTFTPSDGTSFTYLPTGIGTNTSSQVYTFSSGDVTKKVQINAGGTADII